MMKGWFNPNISPQMLLTKYSSTGKSKYLSILVEQFNLSLYHYLLSLSDKEMAEDALQSTWLKVMKVTKVTNNHTNVKSWLFTIARNTLIDELRRQQKWQWQELVEEELAGHQTEKCIEAMDQLTRFNHALSQLSFYQREVFIFQQEGFSLMEICHLTDESFETVKSRLRYARNNIKKFLGQEL